MSIMVQKESIPHSRPKQGSALLYFLVFVSVLFIGILLFAYAVTKRAHPVYVDEDGRPTNQQKTGTGTSK